MILFKSLLRSPFIINKKMAFSFSGLSSAFLQVNNAKNTEIISLTGQEMDQLSRINHYSTSIDYLKLNNLPASLQYLQFSLHQTKEVFPFSINLHGCLLNRISILLKLLNRKEEFEKNLEQLYFISLSSKGHQNLDTIKNLINYLIALTIFNPAKCNRVLQYLQQLGQPNTEYLLFFNGLNDIRERKQYDQGLSKLSKLPQEYPYEKIFKNNNLAYMKIYCLRQKYKNPVQYLKQLKIESQNILSLFLNTLIEAQNNPEQLINYSEQEIQQSETFKKQIQAYQNKYQPHLPKEILSDKNILKHSNSHIIAMNIASLLFQLSRVDQSFYFLQLSLEKAMKQAQLQRIGMALILIGRCYYLKGSQKWQNIYIDILNHNDTYPKNIIKQALLTYSRLLFQQQRMYEAEHYMNQSFKIAGQLGIEGLILPTYDFSY